MTTTDFDVAVVVLPPGVVAPGRVFDRAAGLGEVPEGHRAMAGREALKVLIRPCAA